jgi:excisionase family DNA binding protein
MLMSEVTSHLRITKPTVYRLVADGALTAHRIGSSRLIRFRRDEVEALVSPVTA